MEIDFNDFLRYKFLHVKIGIPGEVFKKPPAQTVFTLKSVRGNPKLVIFFNFKLYL